MQPAPAGRTAFVLAGGGSFGAVQVGMLKALAAAGVVPDLVVGSSVGALNAACYAADPTVAGVARLEQVWTSLRRRDVFPIDWRRMVGGPGRSGGLVRDDGLRGLIDRHLPYRDLGDAALPLHVVATDVLSGAAVVLSRGPAADAILASCAIPAAFAPVPVGGRLLVDGAITSNTPVRVAVGLGATRLIVLPTGFACALQAPPRGLLASALHAISLLIARQLVDELEGMPASIDYAVIPSLCPQEGSAYDFSQTGRMMALAEAGTRTFIEGGGLQRRVIPDGLRAHHHGTA
jgi:NTE family protein